ncbi:MAG: ParA family protein [Chloroflexota bacterium]|nr:ParA family protein [Chloroflexota bacterium]
MKTIAIGNQKGGTGKTATTYALGDALARIHGRRVLLVDVDPQSSLTKSCKVDVSMRATLADVLGGASPGDARLGQSLHDLGGGLMLAPSSIQMSKTELGLFSRMGRESVLTKALKQAHDSLDVVLIDCPPSLSFLTVNALAAADFVIIPTQPQVVDIAGLSLFTDTVDQVKQEINPDLTILGTLLTFYDTRLKHHASIIDRLDDMGLNVFETKIGRSIRVAEAAEAGQSVISYAPDNKRALEYKQFAEEILQWLK